MLGMLTAVGPCQVVGRISGSGKDGDGRAGQVLMDLRRTVPVQGLVWADRVELDPEGISFADRFQRHQRSVPYRGARTSRDRRPVRDPVVSRGVGLGADMARLGVCGGEVLEPERAELSAVVGDQSDQEDLTGIGIGEVVDQPKIFGHGFGLSQGEFDPDDGVVLVRGR